MSTILQARLLAVQADNARLSGDPGTAVALALEGLSVEPLAIEPERALNAALSELRETFVMSGRENVEIVKYSPDGMQIITAEFGGAIRIWDAKTGEFVSRINTETNQLAAFDISPDGERIVTGGWGGEFYLTDLESKEAIATITSDVVSIGHAVFTPDGKLLLTEGYSDAIRIWDGKTGEAVGAFSEHAEDSHIRQLLVSPDGERVFSADDSGAAWIWPIARPKDHVELKGGGGDIEHASFSPDGSQIAAVNRSDGLQIWDTSGKEQHRIAGKFETVVFSPEGTRLATAGTLESQHGAAIWNSQTGELIAEFATKHRAKFVAFLHDGAALIVDDGQNLSVWDIETEKRRDEFRASHEEWRSALIVSPDEKAVVTLGGNSNSRLDPPPATARLWTLDQVAPKIPSLELVEPGEEPSRWGRRLDGLVFSPDGGFVGAWDEFSEVAWLWNLKTFESVLLEHTSNVTSLKFSPNSQQVLTGDEAGGTRLWNASSGEMVIELEDPDCFSRLPLFSIDGTALAVCEGDGFAIKEIETGAELFRSEYEDPFAQSLLSPDGRYVFGLGESASSRFDLETGESIEVKGPVDVNGISFTPDGDYLLSGSDGVISLTNIETGEKQYSVGWFSPDSTFNSMTLSPDGHRIATAGPGDRFWIRDSEQGDVIQIIRDRANSAYFSPDNELLIVAGSPTRLFARSNFGEERWAEIKRFDWNAKRAVFTPDGQHILAFGGAGWGEMRLYPVPERADALIAKARKAAPRCLSVPEREHYFLNPEPPRWCITGSGKENNRYRSQWYPEHPYRFPRWVDWQQAKDTAGSLPTSDIDR